MSPSTKGESTRAAILQAALEKALGVGLEGLSLGVLADACGLSKSGLFAHFKSKEALQLAVVEEAVLTFADKVVSPALTRPRGEPRLRALFLGKLAWFESNGYGRGCIFAALQEEFDDRPGPVRDRLLQAERDWRGALVKAAALAVREGHFAPGADPEQLAFEVEGIDASYRHHRKFLADASAHKRAVRAYERLVDDARQRQPRG
jgi:AcrR family transcriptional regulator